MKAKIKIAPSILAADRSNLQKEVEQVEKYADLLHIDVMDGKFVLPTGLQADEIKKIKSKLPKDVHLMVDYPIKEKYIDNFIDAGASSITIHEECKEDVFEVLDYIKNKKIKSAISIKPATAIDKIKKYLDKVDMVLIMAVSPGYSGQKFVNDVLPKIRELRRLKPNMDIEVDGGINKDTIKRAYGAGANVFVAASSIFGSIDRKKAIKELREAILR